MPTTLSLAITRLSRKPSGPYFRDDRTEVFFDFRQLIGRDGE